MSGESKPNGPAKIVALPGDGVGPEITEQALAVLDLCCAAAGRKIEVVEMLIGGAATDAGEPPLPDKTRDACVAADAVLLGAVGGPKYDLLEPELRPERGLLALRKALGVYTNIRPVKTFAPLAEYSPLKTELARGTDLVVVRELLGGIYFGIPKGIDDKDGVRRAYNTMVYSEPEIQRVARVAFEIARGRKKRVMSVDKANVLDVSRFWREVVTDIHQKEFSDVALDHQYVDSAAMDLIRQPSKFDVIVTGNLFGDILTDEAAVLAGSIGLLPSASLGDGPGLYEPIHGSAPDIAGQGIANPLGTIASVAMMLRSSLAMPAQADRLERAIESVLTQGIRTKDLGGNASTKEMGAEICRALEPQA